jgi:hypothetical protein
MNRYWSGVLAAAVLAAGASGGAQGQNPANVPPADANAPRGVQQTPQPPSAQGRAENKITVVGCVQSGGSIASGAAAGRTTDPAAKPNTTGAATFVLTDARMAAGGSTSPVGTTGTAAGMTYQLDGTPSQLSAHVNHQVRVTGTLQGNASATGVGRASGDSTAGSTRLKVESVEMVANTCPPSAATAPRAVPAEPAVPAQPGRGDQPTQPADPARPATPPAK